MSFYVRQNLKMTFSEPRVYWEYNVDSNVSEGCKLVADKTNLLHLLHHDITGLTRAAQSIAFTQATVC